MGSSAVAHSKDFRGGKPCVALMYTRMCAFLGRGIANGIPQTLVHPVIFVTLLGSGVRRKFSDSFPRDTADMCGLTPLGCTSTQPLGALLLGLSKSSSHLAC